VERRERRSGRRAPPCAQDAPLGLAAFERRKQDNTGIYSYEQRDAARLNERQEERFRANSAAWDFFQDQTPSYRKTAVWWVVSAKKEATREKRLATLIDDSSHGRTIAPLTRRTAPPS
jgi:uncharacterized protein YdeI (YjbR/CyaY-like superfamily)